jgi:hypothetical protein
MQIMKKMGNFYSCDYKPMYTLYKDQLPSQQTTKRQVQQYYILSIDFVSQEIVMHFATGSIPFPETLRDL